MDNGLKAGFGRRLREERERLGLTQKNFAEKAGIKRVTQFLYEKEESQPNYRYLTALAKLDVDMHYLLFGRRLGAGHLDFTPGTLRAIYRIVDEVARDHVGNPLPLESRMDCFAMLCAAYTGRDEAGIDVDAVRAMLNK